MSTAYFVSIASGARPFGVVETIFPAARRLNEGVLVPVSLEPVFQRLRTILRAHGSDLPVSEDTVERFGLEAPVGSATIKAWGGKARASKIPVAWVEVRKNYVSYHLMGIYMNPKLQASLSPGLRGRMQGKSCFNFREIDADLFKELDSITGESLRALQNEGFIVATAPRAHVPSQGGA